MSPIRGRLSTDGSGGVDKQSVIAALEQVEIGGERIRRPTGGCPRVAVVTLCYPTAETPHRGVFVRRRMAGVARLCDLRVLRVNPWFPGMRAAIGGGDGDDGVVVRDERMFYLPGVAKSLDASWFARATRRGLQAIMTAGPIDLVDAQFEWPDGVGAWMAARSLGLRVNVTLRGKLVSQSGYWARRRALAAMLRDADGLIAVGAPLARLAEEVAGRPLEIAVIPNGVDASEFRPVSRKEALARLGWSPLARWVVSVGHLQRLKGFDLLIRALPRVRASLGDVRLALIGGGAGEPGFERELRRLARRLAPEGCVRFAGRLAPDRVNDALNAADLFALASRSEGCCNAVLEALAAGAAVVATDVGSNREAIVPPENGLICPPHDIGSLANAMIEGLSRAWDRASIRARGAGRTWVDAARETVSMYRAVLGR